MSKETAKDIPLRRLNATEIDWSLYTGLEAYEIGEASFVTEFWSESYELVRTHYGKIETLDHVGVKKSRNLQRFLDNNRPSTIFFDPAEITSLLTPNSSIVFKHRKTKTYEQWIFSLNPKGHNFSEDDVQYRMTFTRPLTEASKARLKHTEPYLVVEFPTKYDEGLIIFYPEISGTYGDLWPVFPKGRLQEKMLTFLGVEEKNIEQKLDFSLNKRQRNFPDRHNIYSVRVDLAKTQE